MRLFFGGKVPIQPLTISSQEQDSSHLNPVRLVAMIGSPDISGGIPGKFLFGYSTF
jgi:hypothetical protein